MEIKHQVKTECEKRRPIVWETVGPFKVLWTDFQACFIVLCGRTLEAPEETVYMGPGAIPLSSHEGAVCLAHVGQAPGHAWPCV